MDWGLGFVRDRAERRGESLAAAAALNGHLMDVPAVDPDHVVVDFQDGEAAPPVTFHMTYRDSHGRVSGRIVTVRSIREEFGDVRIGAYCHGRKAFRSFLASRIVSVTDLSTGEVHDDPLAYFEGHALRAGIHADAILSLETLAMQECRDEVSILVAVACADGDFADEERDAIVQHVMDRVPEEGLREGEIRRRIAAYGPDELAFQRALDRLCNGKGDAHALMRSLRRVVDADGELDPEEVAFVLEVEQRLSGAGRI